MESVEIFDLKIHAVDYPEALEKIGEFIRLKQPGWAVCINPEKAVKASQDQALKDLLNQGTLCLADGTGIILAAKVLRDKHLKRVTGIDLMKAVVKEAWEQEYSMFLLGAKPGVAEEVAGKWQDMYPGLKVVGVHHGYFSAAEEEKVRENIRESSPDILLVALGSPRQEKWITTHLDQLGVPFLMGVGGSFDVESGHIIRAPLFWQNIGLEWLYRLLKEPSRILRMGFLPRFAVMFFKAWINEPKARRKGNG